MDSLLSGIIDCVARPSTTDTPVRVVRKTASESPTCVSTTPGQTSSDSDLGYLGSNCNAEVDEEEATSSAHDDNESEESTSTASNSRTFLGVEQHVPKNLALPPDAGDTSSSAYIPINSVLTTEGIIMGGDRAFCGATCGIADMTSCYNDVVNTGCVGTTTTNNDDDDDEERDIVSNTIDANITRQFDSAFATFLYKNPAFTSMSHTTIQKLRARLLKESARNIQIESELRTQLNELRQAKLDNELVLQRELLIVTKAKAAREAELLIQIEKKRRACALMSTIGRADESSLDEVEWQYQTMSSTMPTISTDLTRSHSFDEFQLEIQKNKMEQAHILAEISMLQIAIDEEVNHQSCPSSSTP